MAASRGKLRQQALHMRARFAVAMLARPLCRVPARGKPIGRRHRQHADAPSVLAQQSGRLDRLGRNRTRVDDGELRVRARAGATSSRRR